MATDLNRFMVIGRIVKDLDDKTFVKVGSTTKATVSIANNRSVKKNDQWVDDVSFFDIDIWGKTAENLKPYLVKGTQVAFEAHLHQDRWEKEGKKYSKVTIIADSVQLLGGKKDGGKASDSSAPAEPNDYNPSDGFPEDVPF